MSDFLAKLLELLLGERELSLLRNAPVAVKKIVFVITVIEIFVLWLLFSWIYDKQVDALTATIQLKEEHIQFLKGQPSTLRKENNNFAIAMVDKDGAILSKENFAEYGLSVKKIEFKGYPAYQLTFEKDEPARIRIEAEESANRELVKLTSKQYRVRFIGTGFGNPILESKFTVEAFK